MNSETDKIRKRYNRVSKIYDIIEKPMESMLGEKWRGKLIEEIEGKKILEVGIGTGKNIPYYPKDIDVIGIDFSENMVQRANERANSYPNVDIIQMDAQNMTFEDNMFDTVITSCVFCSVPDPIKGLKEIKRVCKPNGKIIMLEHMRSEDKIIGKAMDIINPIPLYIWGANINRKTMENLQRAGYSEDKIQIEDIWRDIVKLIKIRNKKN